MADPRRASTGQAPRMVMGPPETPGRLMQASPNMFPSLQFSPDMFSTAAFGPATAPAYPQQRLFWDPNMNSMDGTVGLQPYQDPFAISQAEFNDSFNSTTTIIPPFDSNQHLSVQQPYDLPPMSRPMSTSYVDGAIFPAPFGTSPRAPPLRDENPSMFLSSPARRFNYNDNQPAHLPSNVVQDKPAYHHQIEESRREREAKRQRKSDVKHPSVTRSVMEALRRPVCPAKDARPGLKRSSTHSGVNPRLPPGRQQSHVSFLDNISNASGSTNRSGRTGRASPLKSFAASINRQQAGSRNSKRTSLSLAIDENGVAKTVVTKIPDDVDMDLDDDTSESEVSSRDESDFQILRSQPGSFAFPDDDIHDNAQMPNSRLQGHSKSSSYSTMASQKSAVHSSRTSSTYSAANARVPNRGPGQRKPPMLESMREDTNMTVPNGVGDAQQALRAILQDRSRSTSAHEGSVGSHHSIQFNSSPPIQQHQFSHFNASPTTITDPDLATPSTDRGSFTSTGSTRCVCNSSEPSSFMIQCDSCGKWLHTMCIGIDSRQVPEVYVCIYCSQTPMRGGRIRDPRRSSMTIAASPLAHKSHRDR